MTFNIMEFIPSPEVREACIQAGRVFSAREKACITACSSQPLNRRILAYRAIAQEDETLRPQLLCVADQLSRLNGEFQTETAGAVYMTQVLQNRNSWEEEDVFADLSFEAAYARGMEISKGERGFFVFKAIPGRKDVVRALFWPEGTLGGICIREESGQEPYPELDLMAKEIKVPLPFVKGDLVCDCFRPDEPLIFLGDDFSGSGCRVLANRTDGGLYETSVTTLRLVHYKNNLSYGELQIAQKAVRGEIGFFAAHELLNGCMFERKLGRIDLRYQNEF